MKTIQLTQGFVALVDDADYERVSALSWHALVPKNKRTVYAVHGKGLRMHRFILGLTDPRVQTDHEDHDGLNNQRYNLRICTQTQNQRNKPKLRGTFTSQYKGVELAKGRWRSRITIGYSRKSLGVFTSELDAALAYDAAAREWFGEFACCNFPPKKPTRPAATIADALPVGHPSSGLHIA
jgi:hypothetical protein